MCITCNLPQVGMTALSSVIDSLVLFFGTGIVEHISIVVLTLLVECVLLYQILFIRKLQNDGEEAKKRQHDVLMQSPLEHLDLR